MVSSCPVSRPLSALRLPLGLALAWVAAISWAPPRAFTGLGAPRHAANRPGTDRLARASRGGASFEKGMKVKAKSPDDEQWYPGTVDGENDDGTFTVMWDDPEGGPESNDIVASDMKEIIIFKDYAVGDDVQAMSPDDSVWYPGSVTKVNADGSFQVTWDDPDGGPETADVQPSDMKKVTVFKGYQVNDVVEALFPDDGQMYAAKVKKVNGDGTFEVEWEDSDGGPESSVVKAKEMKYPPIPFEKLEVGQKYTGTVRTILNFGAFVDFGADTDGLVHISRITREERVENVGDYLEEGQEVEVWISGLRDDGKVGLSMIEGLTESVRRGPVDISPFEGLDAEEWLEGKVASIASFGAFVTVTSPDGSTTADGLVHISQIRDGFVDDVGDELQVGQDVKVRVVRTEGGKLSLSMRDGSAAGGGGGGGFSPREPADLTAFEAIPPDQWLEGKVARTASFGAFVTVTLPDDGASADGLVHITQIRDGFVESVEDELQPGQEVQVRVQSVDVGAGKLSLSMKPPDEF